MFVCGNVSMLFTAHSTRRALAHFGPSYCGHVYSDVRRCKRWTSSVPRHVCLGHYLPIRHVSTGRFGCCVQMTRGATALLWHVLTIEFRRLLPSLPSRRLQRRPLPPRSGENTRCCDGPAFDIVCLPMDPCIVHVGGRLHARSCAADGQHARADRGAHYLRGLLLHRRPRQGISYPFSC